VLEQALANHGRQPLRDWVEGAWLRLGGPACVEDETALEDAAAYFDLLEGLEGGADLTDFEWLREQVRLLFAQPNTQAGPRLQLMTIHKAKGLEFDSVILPSLESPPRKDDPRLLLWLEQRGELLLAPISESGRDTDPIYRYLDRMERRKMEQETGRLLYVAATRARRRLHLLGSVKKKDDGSIAEPAPGSFLKLLWPAVSESFADISHPQPNEQPKTAHMLRRVPADWEVPAPPPAVPWKARTIEKVELPRVTYEWVSDRLRHTGTAMHGLLQRIAREGLDVWNEETVRSRRSRYEAVLANLGISPAELPEAAKRVETALLRTLRDPRGRWILAAHSEAACEVSIAGLIDGKLSESIIDRTFIDEAGVRWIIDYKTSDHQGSDLENFFEAEKERYKEQLERYARLMFQRNERPIRLGLYFPLLGGWREWGAPVVLRKQATLFEL
jgi:ATP-dependent exoDNAse (exonuclease V) beta subunit